MKIKEIREKTDAEMVNFLEELRKEKLNLKIQSRTGQLENSTRLRTVRRDIAKVLTEMQARSTK